MKKGIRFNFLNLVINLFFYGDIVGLKNVFNKKKYYKLDLVIKW